MLVAGAVGTLVLGPVADRLGLRRTLLVTRRASGPRRPVRDDGWRGRHPRADAGRPVRRRDLGVTIVLSQLYLPRTWGWRGGLSVGLAMGLGGIAAVALGAVADAVDLETALYVAAAAPVVGCVVCLLLRPSASRPPEVAPAA